jgi:hypothetical protein
MFCSCCEARNRTGQIIALEKAKTEKEADGEFESKHPGLLRPGCVLCRQVAGCWCGRASLGGTTLRAVERRVPSPLAVPCWPLAAQCQGCCGLLHASWPRAVASRSAEACLPTWAQQLQLCCCWNSQRAGFQKTGVRQDATYTFRRRAQSFQKSRNLSGVSSV